MLHLHKDGRTWIVPAVPLPPFSPEELRQAQQLMPKPPKKQLNPWPPVLLEHLCYEFLNLVKEFEPKDINYRIDTRAFASAFRRWALEASPRVS